MTRIAGLIDWSGSRKAEPPVLSNLLEEMNRTGVRRRIGLAIDASDQATILGDTDGRIGRALGVPSSPSLDLPGAASAKVLLGLGQPSYLSWEQGLYGLPASRSWIVWDGALYNRSGLEKLLRGEGVSLQTRGDAELVLQAYRLWGQDCLRIFNGRWSFLLYDGAEGIFWAARDRFGVKPFYYHRAEGTFAFASEQKALLRAPFVPQAFDAGAVFDYFVRGRVEMDEETLFAGIRQLLPAHAANGSMVDGAWAPRQYYQLGYTQRVGTYDPGAFAMHTGRVRELLLDATRQRLKRQSAAPATLLSGGLDSSVLAVAIKRMAPASPLTALTAAYAQSEIAEQQWAEIVALTTEARWIKVYPQAEQLRKELETFIYAQDTPTFSTGTYAQHCLFRQAAREGLPVIFDGQGADALFGGHLPYLSALWSDLFRTFQWGSLVQEMKNSGLGPKGYWRDRLKYRWLPRWPAALQYAFQRSYFKELSFLQPELLRSQRHRLRQSGPSSGDGLNAALYEGFTQGGMNFLLKCVDRAAAWHGVDTATPYADDLPLIEYVFSIPPVYKIHHGQRKWLLREAFREMLPEAIYQRPDKKPLLTPNNEWIASMRDAIRPYFEEQDEAIFNKKRLLDQFDQFFNPASPVENYRMYKFVSLAVWRKVFNL